MRGLRHVVIRADASVHIGTGHIMRTLTLADELRERGSEVVFVCRELPGHICRVILGRGFRCLLLPPPAQTLESAWQHLVPQTLYEQWLSVSVDVDAAETLHALQSLSVPVDWLIVDHYALDARWQCLMRSAVQRIMVIDDIANRPHDCEVLLDQNLYDHAHTRYEDLVSKNCTLLLSPHYALLRPEFQAARMLRQHKIVNQIHVHSPQPHKHAFERFFVFFGGADTTNETHKALQALELAGCREHPMDIVVGTANPHKNEIAEYSRYFPNAVFHCQVNNIAALMVQADIALGAGGTTTWERCCLGLPTVAVIIAENQREMTEIAAEHGLQWNAGDAHALTTEAFAALIQTALHDRQTRNMMALRGRSLVDGLGAVRVADALADVASGHRL